MISIFGFDEFVDVFVWDVGNKYFEIVFFVGGVIGIFVDV